MSFNSLPPAFSNGANRPNVFVSHGPQPQPLFQADKTNPDKPYQKNPYAPNPNAELDKAIYTFKAPEPKTWMQRLLLSLNRRIMLPWVRKTQLELPPAELQKLRAIPKNAGNILVGPHPDNEDGGLMFDLYRRAGVVPAGFFIGSEVLVRQSRFVQKLMAAIGAIPVARGKSNPEATQYLTDKIAEGGWGGIFPEGTVYLSRQVMPMEYGAFKISLEAALKVREEALAKGVSPKSIRPILVTPFAHVYYHTNLKKMLKTMDAKLAEIEEKPEFFGKKQTGKLTERIKQVADKLLEERAKRYNIPLTEFADPDIFESAHKLENLLLETLEKKYKGAVQTGFSRRRAIKLKMMIVQELNTKPLSDDRKKELKTDLQKTLDIATLTSFNREYMNQYNDIEMWGEFLRRLRDMVGLDFQPFGHRKAVMHILPSVDMHEAAENYLKIEGEEKRQQFLFDLTESARQRIQQEVTHICKTRPAKTLDI